MLKDSMLSSLFSVHVLKIARNWLLRPNWPPKDSLAADGSRETGESRFAEESHGGNKSENSSKV